MHNFRLTYIFVFSLTPFVIYAGGQDNSKVWNVVFSEFQTSGGGAEIEHFKDSVPLELMLSIKVPMEHHLSPLEQEGYKKRERAKLKIKAGKELSLLYIDRDKLAFQTGGAASEKYIDINEEIDKKKSLLKKIEMGEKDILVPGVMEIELSGDNSTVRELKENRLEDLYGLKGYDQAVYGKLEVIDNWIYISVFVYNYLTGKEQKIYDTVTSPESLSNLIPGIFSSLKRALLGYDTATLDVKGEPEDAFISIDGGDKYLTGTGPVEFPPGQHILKITKDGYLSKTVNVILKRGKKITVKYSLEKIESGFLSLTTFPQGADIYSGSIWIGVTPHIINNPVYPVYLTFKKEGYNDFSTSIDEGSNVENLRFSLTKGGVNYEDLIELRRKEFYSSFASFVLSLAVPVVGYGFSSDYGYAYNSLVTTQPWNEETQRLKRSSLLWYNVYLGGVFASASLFVNMAINLWDYIKIFN